ncbi:MAG TPA: VOC family protein [bacterium]|nr:VOC family protein [bacterium]
MKPKIDLITILTDNVPDMVEFYTKVLGFQTDTKMDTYVELVNEGARFAICQRSVMMETTSHPSYQERRSGQSFELAFPVDTPEQVDQIYADILVKGAIPVKPPDNMPWGQRAAFFADPDGNIHELFAELA